MDEDEYARSTAFALASEESGARRNGSVDTRRVHLLGSFEPQSGGLMFLTFTGNWSWYDGAMVSRAFSCTAGYRLPDGFEMAAIYAVCDEHFPSPLAFFPTICATPTAGGGAGSEYLTVLDDFEFQRDWLEYHIDWKPCATASGAEFAKRGLSVFFPELPDW